MKVNTEDEDWFLHFRQGDMNAFRRLYELHYRSILYFASSILQKDSFAEDIAIDVFCKAWNHRTRFETSRHLENFLFFVTRNSCISFLRSERTFRNTREEWSQLTEGPEDDAGTRIDLEKVKTQLIERLHHHLEHLNGGEVLRMAFLEGKTTKEIAEKLQITENNVYIIKSRSIKILRQLMLEKQWLLLLLFLVR